MLKHSCFYLTTLLLLCLTACDLTDTGGGTGDKEVTGVWEPGAGLSHPFSFRNARYTFEVKADKSTVDITLNSPDVNVALWLYNPLGQLVTYNWGNRRLYSVEESGKGKWTVTVGTQDIGESGKFKVCLVGKFQNFRKEQANPCHFSSFSYPFTQPKIHIQP
jgi:hypothetical protein